ncbi:MAG TPA: hypothetical protein VFM43_06155 [Gaiellaceae bacterium]|nr:hypothetical protein [Gaiellaceae bacterium]
MKRAEFESLLFVEVADRARDESASARSDRGRPWTQLRDEMLASGAKTVEELRAERIATFYKSTNATEGGVLAAFKGLFGPARPVK